MVNRLSPEFRDLQIASCNACIDRLTAAAADQMPTPCPAHTPITEGEFPEVDKLYAHASSMRTFLPLITVIAFAGLFAFLGHPYAAAAFGAGSFLILAVLFWERVQS